MDEKKYVAGLIDLYAPQPNACIFHLDNTGARILDFVEEVPDEERQAFLNAPLDLKVIPFGGLLYICHAFESGSWNDAPVNCYSDERLYQTFLDSHAQELEIAIEVIDLTERKVIATRNERMTPEMTDVFVRTLQSQKERGLDELLATESLGDTREMIHTLSQPGLPRIHEIKVDHEARTTQILADLTSERQNNEPRPRWSLRSLERIPSVDFRYYEQRAATTKAAGREFPWKYCFFPVTEVMASELERAENTLRDQLVQLGVSFHDRDYYIQDAIGRAADQTFAHTNLAVMLNWRQSQGVYRFDPEILKSLYLTTLPVHLDPVLLTRLPEYCVYIETPGLTTETGAILHGFFAMAESVPREALSENLYDTRFYIVLDHGPEDKLVTPQILTFSLNVPTLKEALANLAMVDKDHGDFVSRSDLALWATPLLSQLLYICSTEPEIRTDSQPDRQPTRPSPQKTRKGYKLFPPSSVTVWNCGWRTGAAIRFEKEQRDNKHPLASGSKRSPRGYVRRAHWHAFYAGPRKAVTRELRLHWLSMINVNLPVDSERPTVIRAVKEDTVMNAS